MRILERPKPYNAVPVARRAGAVRPVPHAGLEIPPRCAVIERIAEAAGYVLAMRARGVGELSEGGGGCVGFEAAADGCGVTRPIFIDYGGGGQEFAYQVDRLFAGRKELFLVPIAKAGHDQEPGRAFDGDPGLHRGPRCAAPADGEPRLLTHVLVTEMEGNAAQRDASTRRAHELILGRSRSQAAGRLLGTPVSAGCVEAGREIDGREPCGRGIGRRRGKRARENRSHSPGGLQKYPACRHRHDHYYHERRGPGAGHRTIENWYPHSDSRSSPNARSPVRGRDCCTRRTAWWRRLCSCR